MKCDACGHPDRYHVDIEDCDEFNRVTEGCVCTVPGCKCREFEPIEENDQ